MAQATANFEFPYPTTSDPIQVQALQSLANNLDTACTGLAGAGTCVQMRQQAGSFRVQTSNRFINDYDGAGVTFSYYSESDSTRLWYNVATGLVRVPAGFTVLAWGMCAAYGYPGAGTFAIGLGSATSSTATTPTNDYGGALTPTQAGLNYSFIAPPTIITAANAPIYVGLYCRSQQTPPLNEYKLGVITLLTGISLM